MVTAENPARYFKAWSGLISGPGAWAVSTQLNYALVPWQCGNHAYPIPWVALGLIIIALAGAGISFLSWRRAGAGEGGVALAAGVGALTGVLFALVIALQGSAALIFTGCER
jgi:hypothetical protein